MVKILRASDGVCQVILLVDDVVSERDMDRRVLTADIDADLGLITCVDRGFGQRARLSTQERSCACRATGSSQYRRRRILWSEKGSG